MPAIRQTNFSAGELDPKLWGRTDLDVFGNGLRTCKNFIPTHQGPVISRPGTLYVAATKNNTYARLVPFYYADGESYVLEFGANYFRVHQNGAPVLSLNRKLDFDGQTVNFPAATLITGGTSGATGTIVSQVDAGATGTLTLSGVVGTFLDNEAITGGGGNGVVNGVLYTFTVEVSTDWALDEVDDIKFAQTGDTLVVTHPDREIYEIKRTAHTVWTNTALSLARVAPFWADITLQTTETLEPMLVDTTLVAADAAHPLREWIWLVTVVVQDNVTGLI